MWNRIMIMVSEFATKLKSIATKIIDTLTSIMS